MSNPSNSTFTTVYIDAEYRCHTTNPDGLYRQFEVSGFDGKCTAFIEGHRFVPRGESWTREDGETFRGEMMSPWRPHAELVAAQTQYELDQEEAADMQAALEILGVSVDG